MKVECRSLIVLDRGMNIIIDANEIIDLSIYINMYMPKCVKERIDVWVHELSELSILEVLSKFLSKKVYEKRIEIKKGENIIDNLISHYIVSLHCISISNNMKIKYPEDNENIILSDHL